MQISIGIRRGVAPAHVVIRRRLRANAIRAAVTKLLGKIQMPKVSAPSTGWIPFISLCAAGSFAVFILAELAALAWDLLKNAFA